MRCDRPFMRNSVEDGGVCRDGEEWNVARSAVFVACV
jgi:hypothetical protein